MAYKWKPSAQQKADFKERMKNPEEVKAYEQRKVERADKKRSSSQFNYQTAGGMYIPTKQQFDFAFYELTENKNLDKYQKNACEQVMSGYSLKEKIHHDYIHIVNELIREKEGLKFNKLLGLQ